MSLADDLQQRALERIPRLYEHPRYRWYARGKLRGDGIYAAVLRHLNDDLPILDIGCGIGLMAFYLRSAGRTNQLLGLDLDPRKISAARDAQRRSTFAAPDLSFELGNARELPPFSGHVLLLDVVHYLPREAQAVLVREAASRVATGGRLILRDAIRDGSWRARLTMVQERFSRTIGWLRGERLEFPSRDALYAATDEAGLRLVAEEPMFAGNPFNNHLLVWERSGSTVDHPPSESR